jgi:hypothetical protein
VIPADGFQIEAISCGRGFPRENAHFAFFGSAVLHGLLLLFVLLLTWTGTHKQSKSKFHIIPVDMVQLGEETASPAQPLKAFVPQKKATPKPRYNPVPQGVAPDKAKPLPDELESKLRTLSKLHQTPSDTPLEGNETGTSNVSAESDGAVRGPRAVYSLRDYIRAQVERRWSLDLEKLASHDVAIPIRIEITSKGIVTKAEIVEAARAAKDHAYRDVAISARNAVLLSSPIALPAGDYKPVMEVTLLLNPKDTLR